MSVVETTAAEAPATDAELVAFPDTAERRLRRALRKLDVALAEQREAVAAFRANLAELNGAVSGLSDSAGTLRGALDGAAAEVAKAQHAARELTATAEMMERVARA